MASYKVLLFVHKKANAQGYPLMLRVTESRKSRYLSLGIRCHENEWDSESEQPTKKHPQRHEFSTLIHYKKQQVLKEILAAENAGEMLSAKKIMDRVRKPKTDTSMGVYAFARAYVEKLKAGAGALRTADIYGTTIRALQFFDPKEFYFSDITVSWLEQFETYYRSRGTRDTTITIHLRNVRQLYNQAIEQELALEKDYPFKKYKISKLDKSTQKRALTKQDMLALISFPTQEGSEKRFAQKLFAFSYFLNGINLKDIALLKQSNIQQGRVQFIRAKTKKPFSIKLRPETQAILDEMATYPNTGGYLFPILSEFHTTERQKLTRIVRVNHAVNLSLREIAKECVVDKHITFYVARHSYATVLKRSGVPISQISETMGHASEAITQVYLDSFDEDTLDAVAANLL